MAISISQRLGLFSEPFRIRSKDKDKVSVNLYSRDALAESRHCKQ